VTSGQENAPVSEDTFEVVIIGAGIIGCAIAHELRRRGWTSILLLDRGRPGHAASRAALGGLPPCMEPAPSDEVALLYRRSLQLYPAWVDVLRAETNIDPGFVISGSLLVALSPDHFPILNDRHEWLKRKGWPAERLTQQQLTRLEPALKAGLGALLMPEDARVNNVRLVDALVQSVQQSGVSVWSEHAAALWFVEGELRGVECGSARISARLVINAAGAWAGHVGGPKIPIFAVKGQALALQARPLLSERMVASPDCYLVPRNDGTVILGSTVEPHVTNNIVTAGGVVALLNAGRALWPQLDDCQFLGAWAGLRPESSDHLPVLGPWPTVPNLIVAGGFFKMGITLAPLVAQLLADYLSGQGHDPALDTLSPSRFAASA
jgi:glycine oxidase